MTQEQENYIKSFNSWVKGSRISIELSLQIIDNSEKMIKYHKQTKDLEFQLLIDNQKQLSNAIDNFNEWCELNNLDEEQIINK